MFKQLLLFSSILALSSCAYIYDESIQDLAVLTPGAENTVCYVYVDGLRYEAHPPQPVHISKSSKDMTVDCLAPGNRRRKIVVQSTVSKHESWNIANGIIPGAAWDAASNSFYSYPETVTVDFTSAQVGPEPIPAHNNPDIKQPEEYNLEEFTSGLPRLNSDRYNQSEPIRRRQPATVAPGYTESTITEQPGPGKPADKGDLQSVIDGLNGNINPSGAQSTPTAAPATAPSLAPASAAPSTSTSAPKAVAPAPSTQTFGPGTPNSPSGVSSPAGPPVPIYPGQ